MNADTVRKLVECAKANDQDPVEVIQDYFADKDSRFSRAEVERIINRILGENHA